MSKRIDRINKSTKSWWQKSKGKGTNKSVGMKGIRKLYNKISKRKDNEDDEDCVIEIDYSNGTISKRKKHE